MIYLIIYAIILDVIALMFVWLIGTIVHELGHAIVLCYMYPGSLQIFKIYTLQ